MIETHEQVARLEQRNGRIDRKLQPQPVVYCRYFVYTQRPEDRVLGVLARKTETIREELGSFNDVLSRKLKHGIRRDQATRLAEEIDALENPAAHNATENELEVVRRRHEELRNEIAPRERQLRDSQREEIGHASRAPVTLGRSTCTGTAWSEQIYLARRRRRGDLPDRYAFRSRCQPHRKREITASCEAFRSTIVGCHGRRHRVS